MAESDTAGSDQHDPHDHHDHDGPVTLEERHEHEAETYDALSTEWLDGWPDQDYLLDVDTPPYPNKEHVLFLDHLLAQFRPFEGKKILETGTGTGNIAVWLAMNGAEVTGCDVSSGILEIAEKRARLNGVEDRLTCVHQPIESLDLPDESFDVVMGNVCAHHFEFDLAGKNIYRLLKPGGVAVYAEPVLFIPKFVSDIRQSKIVRKRFPDVKHSPDERAFTRETVEQFGAAFDRVDLEYFGILSRVQNFTQVSDKTYARIEKADEFLLRKVPKTEYLSRFVVMTMHKTA